jgi:nicotinate-nucleotide adenylyltransferase
VTNDLLLPPTIGLFGGTFDPIHTGHLRTAWEILQSLELAEIRFIPCYLPPHRHQPAADAIHRLEMVKLATAGISGFSVDDREIRRTGPSYTVDTLRSLTRELPEHSLCLILGTDAFMSFMEWHSWEEIIKLANVVVMHRPGHQDAYVATPLKNAFTIVTDKDQLRASKAGALFFQPVTPLAISGTAIREEIAQYGCAPFLLPNSVSEYIKTHNLYSPNEE